ncbi:hypothetical protein GCM10011416_14930 [Polaribacter pacificus]|uniref:Protein required for attachment to host cells n=1 Tax=Polaribacter pacificus TaxID=1775173 RepID=A0A917HYC2_9FLAO|nr:hypothetical protein [Polaribacter pacificus]GGG97906.1 hypothetical protein GCM10011416_14930 [Polaribacter pacificus]
MEAKNRLGIWMDHSEAQLIELNLKDDLRTIVSPFTTNTKLEALSRSEDIMHNKEQQMHEEFYKTISSEILKYQHVLLFGPTNAKEELLNYLNKDRHFKDIKIELKSADKMTKNEKFAFVKKFFKIQ